MSTTVTSVNAVVEFKRDLPAQARVAPGTRVRFETDDRSYRDLTAQDIDRGRVRFETANRLAGPIHLDGARPGDAIGVRIESIEIATRAYAVYVARWRRGLFGIPDSVVTAVEIDEDGIHLPNGGVLALHPMIGCIGVAPASGTLSTLSPTARTGGNMDLVELRAGATIWLPVEVDGALLSLGDLHARMGRGEPLGSGLECGGAVVATLLLARDRGLLGPVVTDDERIHFVGTGEDDSAATSTAVRAAWEWLTRESGVDRQTAILLAASLLELNHGGPAGANVVASFELAALRDARCNLDVWPLNATY
jgi:acetamidase/formamidase